MADGLTRITVEIPRNAQSQEAQKPVPEQPLAENDTPPIMVSERKETMKGGELEFDTLTYKPNENSASEIVLENGKIYTKKKITKNGKAEYMYICLDGGKPVAPKATPQKTGFWNKVWTLGGLLDGWSDGVDKAADGLLGINNKTTHTDEADDGSISGAEIAQYFARGAASPIKEMVKKPVQTVVVGAGVALACKGIAAGCVAAGVACPPLGLIMAGVGLAVGLGMFAWGGYKAYKLSRKGSGGTDAEARKAWENMGAGTTTALMSAKALKNITVARRNMAAAKTSITESEIAAKKAELLGLRKTTEADLAKISVPKPSTTTTNPKGLSKAIDAAVKSFKGSKRLTSEQKNIIEAFKHNGFKVPKGMKNTDGLRTLLVKTRNTFYASHPSVKPSVKSNAAEIAKAIADKKAILMKYKNDRTPLIEELRKLEASLPPAPATVEYAGLKGLLYNAGKSAAKTAFKPVKIAIDAGSAVKPALRHPIETAKSLSGLKNAPKVLSNAVKTPFTGSTYNNNGKLIASATGFGKYAQSFSEFQDLNRNISNAISSGKFTIAKQLMFDFSNSLNSAQKMGSLQPDQLTSLKNMLANTTAIYQGTINPQRVCLRAMGASGVVSSMADDSIDAGAKEAKNYFDFAE